MIACKPKGKIAIDFSGWNFGIIDVDPLTKSVRAAIGEVISESFVQYPPDLWCRPTSKDPLRILLTLPALGEWACPEFTASIRGLVLGACQNVDDDVDPDAAARLSLMSSALRRLANEVDARQRRWVQSHPNLVSNEGA